MDATLKQRTQELASELATQSSTIEDLNAAMRELMKSALEKMLNTELDVPLDIPRDREGTFDPQLIPTHQRRLAGFDEKILTLYAKGMTTRDKQDHAANRDPWFTGNTAS